MCPQDRETPLISDSSCCAGFGVLLQPNSPAKIASSPITVTVFQKTLPCIVIVKGISALRAEFRRILRVLRLLAALVAFV